MRVEAQVEAPSRPPTPVGIENGQSNLVHFLNSNLENRISMQFRKSNSTVPKSIFEIRDSKRSFEHRRAKQPQFRTKTAGCPGALVACPGALVAHAEGGVSRNAISNEKRLELSSKHVSKFFSTFEPTFAQSAARLRKKRLTCLELLDGCAHRMI